MATERHTLLLTSCIDPGPGANMVARSDPNQRLQDYCNALRRWLSMNEPRITGLVFVDNSGYDLSPLEHLARAANPYQRRLEFISFDGNFIPAGLDYGFAELGIVDHALDRSELLAESASFAKITGRLFFPRYPRLLDRLPTNFKAVVDARSNLRSRTPTPFVVTTMMLFNVDFYRSLFYRSRDEMRPESGKMRVEHLFMERLAPLRHTEGILLRFPINVDPMGVGAHGNKNYGSAVERTLNMARAVARRTVPDWWL